MTTEPNPEVSGVDESVEDPGWPFGFIAALVLATLYLTWRFIDLGIRLVRWIL